MYPIIKIGNQEFMPIKDYYRYEIRKVINLDGYRFAFSLRKKSIDELIRRDAKLEVTFTEHPDLKFKYRAVEWRNQGKLKKEIHNFKDSPLQMYYFHVNYAGQLSHQKQPEGQQAFKL